MNPESWYKKLVPIGIITFIAITISSNGFQFSKVFFPADVLSQIPPWRAINDHDPASQNPLLRDLVVEFEPWEELVRSALFEKRWPLWNPYSFMGTPLLGNGQISAFTIFSVPLHFLPPIPAHFAEALLKLWVAGLSMYFLGQTLNLGRVASLVAGLVFMLSGHMIAWLHFPLSGGLALAPVLLLASERLLQERSRLWFCVIVISVAMITVCGQPQTTFCVGLFLIAFSIHRLLQLRRNDLTDRHLYRRARWLLIGMVLGLGVSSFQTLSFIEYLGLSAAQSARNAYNVFYLPLYHLITLLLPDFFGNVIHGNYWGYANNVGPAIYIGVLPLLLAITTMILDRRNATTVFFAATALICLVIITKRLGVEQVFQLPVLAGITVNKFIGPFTVSMAFLAGKGVDLFWVRPKAVLKLCTAFLALSGIYVLITVSYFWQWLNELNLRYYEFVRGIPLLALTPVTLMGLWIWYRRSATNGSVMSSPQHSLLVPAVIIVFTACLDPVYYWLNFNPSVESRFFYPSPESIEFLRKDRGIWRLMGIGDALLPNTASYYHLPDSLGYDGMTYKRYFDFMGAIDPGFKDLAATLDVERMASKPWNPRTRLFDEYVLSLLASKDGGFLPYLRQAYYWNTTIQKFQNRRLLDLMNVKYLITPPSWSPGSTIQDLDLVYDKEVRIYLNKNVLPRAIILNNWIWADNDQVVLRMMSEPNFDPRVTAILQNSTLSRKERPPFVSKVAVDGPVNSVKFLSYQDERVVLEAEASSDAVVLLSDVYYPGWKCTIDGQEADIVIADFLFRGIHVPPGKHQIVFFYEPASFVWGLRLTWLATFGTLAALICMRRR